MNEVKTEVRSEIEEALKALGYRTMERVAVQEIAYNRIKVMYNGAYIGIYCLSKHTFID